MPTDTYPRGDSWVGELSAQVDEHETGDRTMGTPRIPQPESDRQATEDYWNMIHEDCDCSEDFGPCEDHLDVLAQREGASTRTADDLAYVFLTDVLAIGEDRGWLAPNMLGKVNADRLRTVEHYWSDDDRWDDNHGCRWVKMPDDDLSDPSATLQDDVQHAEGVLADLGLYVWWDDGYVIGRVTGGPLAD